MSGRTEESYVSWIKHYNTAGTIRHPWGPHSNQVRLSGQSGEFRDERGIAHRCLTHQDSVGPGVAQPLRVLRHFDAALGNERRAGETGGEPLEGPKVHREVLEVAVVDADDARPGLEREPRLQLVVDLDERRQADLDGQRDVAGEIGGVEERRYEQARVAASSTCTSSTVKSLRITGSAVASRAASRSSREPLKRSGSVRTERLLA